MNYKKDYIDEWNEKRLKALGCNLGDWIPEQNELFYYIDRFGEICIGCYNDRWKPFNKIPIQKTFKAIKVMKDEHDYV